MDHKDASTSSETVKTRAIAAPDSPRVAKPVEVLTQQPEAPSVLAGRVTRIMRLLTLLQSNEQLTVQAIANRLGVSRRTVFRDFNVLEKAGVPFINTGDGYELDPEYRMAQLKLGVPEAIGLMVLCKIAQAIPHQPMFGAAIEAVTKCLAQLPHETREVYEDLVQNVTYSPSFVNISEDDERHFCQLQYAIDECITCKLSYNPVGGSEHVCTEIHPLHLHFHKHSWYVLAQSEQHSEVRMFKLTRIIDLEVTNQIFKPIPFSIESHLDGAWGIIPGTRKYDVVIEFSPKVARNVSEIRWHASQTCEMQPDGSCILRFRVNGLDEMKWWLFSYADQAIVREPEELREKIRDMAQRTLNVNRNGA